MRFHPTRGSMSLSVEGRRAAAGRRRRRTTTRSWPSRSAGGGAPRPLAAGDDPDRARAVLPVQRPDLADGRTAELAERLDVRLHTHCARTRGRGVLRGHLRPPAGRLPRRRRVDERPGLVGARRHGRRRGGEPPRRGAGRGGALPVVQHDPGRGLAPVADLRAAGAPVGLGVDGSSSADSASLWLEARTAMLLGKLRHGAGRMSARDALEMATRGGAACLGRTGEIGSCRSARAATWSCGRWTGPVRRRAADPVEAWLRCGPVSARHTVVGGRPWWRTASRCTAGSTSSSPSTAGCPPRCRRRLVHSVPGRPKGVSSAILAERHGSASRVAAPSAHPLPGVLVPVTSTASRAAAPQDGRTRVLAASSPPSWSSWPWSSRASASSPAARRPPAGT